MTENWVLRWTHQKREPSYREAEEWADKNSMEFNKDKC